MYAGRNSMPVVAKRDILDDILPAPDTEISVHRSYLNLNLNFSFRFSVNGATRRSLWRFPSPSARELFAVVCASVSFYSMVTGTGL